MAKQITLEEAEEIRDTYRPIPHMFAKDVLGCRLWSMQEEIMQSVFANKTTAVKTCNAVGKSYVAARIILTFLTLYEGSVVVTTAPTWRQVTDVLWREIATAVKRSKYQLTKNEVRQAGLDIAKDWYAVGLSTKYPENFFGYHADHILVVVDEAGGVPEPIFKGVKAITPNVNARILYIGNPTTPGGTFQQAFDNPRIKNYTISAFDSPNFIQVGIRNIEDLVRVFTPPEGVEPLDHKPFPDDFEWEFPQLISPEVVYERYLEWGTDSPAWESLVMGQFPSQAEQSLIPLDLVIQAMNNYGVDEESGKTYAELSGWNIPNGEIEYGLDMARFGIDKTVLTPRHGGWVEKQVSWGKVDTTDSADRVIKIIDPHKREFIKIDDTGNGGGTTDTLRHRKKERALVGKAPFNYVIVPYNFSSKENMLKPDKYHDITSELYWNLRSWFLSKAIAIPYDKELFNELVSRRWSITPAGKIKVESKDEYKARTGGKSPDKSDSLALAFAERKSGSWNKQTDTDKKKEISQERIAPITSGLSSRY